MSDPIQDLLGEQVAYYRARAAEYDATSTPDSEPFAGSAAAIHDALRAFLPRGRVIEIAAGTGQWTEILAEYADDLLVTDASPEMLGLNRARLGDRANVTYRVEDVFALPASHDRDVAMFGFFLSHVPPERFATFWAVVAGILAPGGRVIFVDEGRHFAWREEWLQKDAGVVRRRLTDGSEYRAVKVLWQPADLQARLAESGWDASVTAEGPFYWGMATRRSRRLHGHPPQ